jgi:hypothetical protein
MHHNIKVKMVRFLLHNRWRRALLLDKDLLTGVKRKERFAKREKLEKKQKNIAGKRVEKEVNTERNNSKN